ncbi:MAG: hypothetical protein IJV14_18300 [Lachnospiraceae bacterium]|nr:hypothetical protein [Lachnospiraceae bacterium]
MAVVDIRNYRRNSGGDSYEYDREGYIEEEPERYIDVEADTERAALIRRSRLRKFGRALGMVGLIAGLVLLIALQTKSRVFTGADYRRMADMIVMGDSRSVALNGHIVNYSRDGASCVDHTGAFVWSITYEMQQPIVDAASDVMAIADLGGSRIYILSSSKIVGTVLTNLPVRRISVSDSGEVAAILEDSDTTWIYLFDSAGNTIAYFKTTMGQSGYPVSVAVSPSGEMVCVSHLTLGGSKVNSSIAFYNFGAVGQNVRENNVSGFNYEDEMFPCVKYLTDDTAVAVSDHRIAFFKGEEIPQSAANIMFSENIEAVYTGNRYVGVLFPDTTGQEKYSLRVFDLNGIEVSKIPFTMDYTNIQINGDRIIIHSDQSLLIYQANGQLKYEGTFHDMVKALVPVRNSGNRLLLVTQTGVEQMILE